MSEIKKREKIKGTIKTLDKGKIITDKTKANIVSIKEREKIVMVIQMKIMLMSMQ